MIEHLRKIFQQIKLKTLLVPEPGVDWFKVVGNHYFLLAGSYFDSNTTKKSNREKNIVKLEGKKLSENC